MPIASFDELVKQIATELGCTSCEHHEDDCCGHKGALCPITMVLACPVSGKVALMKRQSRAKRAVSKPDRSDCLPPRHGM